MARADKAAAVAELATAFRDSQAAVLTEYRGLSVSDLSQLRTALGADVTYSVVKNTLTKIAAREAGLDGLDDLLVGPSAIAFVQGDPVEAAKGLRDFARTHPLLIIKGGVLDGATLTPAELTRLADLESREVLLAKLAGAMKASLSGAAALFQAPLAQAARTVEALRAKVEAEGPVATAAPAADAGGTSDVTDTAASSESADAESADAGSADAGSADAGSADAGSADTGSAGTESADGGSADDGSGATEAPADVVGPVVTTDEPVLTTDGPDAAATASSETPA